MKNFNPVASSRELYKWLIFPIPVRCNWEIVTERPNETKDLLEITIKINYGVTNKRNPTRKPTLTERQTISKLLRMTTLIKEYCSSFNSSLTSSIESADIWNRNAAIKARMKIRANEMIQVKQITAICGNYIIRTQTVNFISNPTKK